MVAAKLIKLNTAVVPDTAQADNPAPLATGNGSMVNVCVQVLKTVPPGPETIKVTVTEPLAVKAAQEAPGIRANCTGPLYNPDEGPDITAFAVLELIVNW